MGVVKTERRGEREKEKSGSRRYDLKGRQRSESRALNEEALLLFSIRRSAGSLRPPSSPGIWSSPLPSEDVWPVEARRAAVQHGARG